MSPLPEAPREGLTALAAILAAFSLAAPAEAPVATGAASAEGRVAGYVEVWRSKGRATWTVTITYPKRRSCALLSGDDWRSMIWQTPEAGGAT